ncbi:CinA family protein [Nocardia noduli]|uniref:CinA family protein n=1 Tax=Nocardia noduli TaxID=2815722 RepID=UPI001C238E4E
MAVGVRSLLDADLAVAVTGAVGPDPQMDHAPGSVWFCVTAETTRSATHCRFDGPPEEVIDRTAEYALRHLLGASPAGRLRTVGCRIHRTRPRSDRGR